MVSGNDHRAGNLATLPVYTHFSATTRASGQRLLTLSGFPRAPLTSEWRVMQERPGQSTCTTWRLYAHLNRNFPDRDIPSSGARPNPRSFCIPRDPSREARSPDMHLYELRTTW